ncbi:MAG TPA: hypothetical protein VMH02_09210 [Verrucomicrobiae bacterium]|nr:hypothetical protein [Verrucomicrobiae bacterium]
MTRIVTFALTLALLGLCSAAVRAQIPVPTPTPNPQVYTDPGMEYDAPPEARLAGRHEIPLEQLGEDLQPIAIWVIDPGKEDARVVQLQMEAFDGPPNQWEGQFESQMHNQQDGVLIKNRTPMTLTNGMPATLVEVTYGDGFDAKKMYAVVFADGQRGIVLSETGRIGEITEQEAQRVLKNAKAVRYPSDQP